MAYVRDVMKKEIVIAKIDDSVKKICGILSKKKMSNIPVVNKKGELRGVVSEQDIIRGMESQGFMKLTAKNIMTESVFSVKENDSLEHAAKMFTEKPFRRLPVLRGKKVIGTVTRDDIIQSFMSDYY
ncbi:MAG: CBS domain-containing protein [Omnitrophica bacterium]|nr:CBS domain-containing protein [Candidatus Omnitrophota bacterium]